MSFPSCSVICSLPTLKQQIITVEIFFSRVHSQENPFQFNRPIEKRLFSAALGLGKIFGLHTSVAKLSRQYVLERKTIALFVRISSFFPSIKDEQGFLD